MIYLGKLLQKNDLRLHVFDTGVITVNDFDVLNDPQNLLNNTSFTTNTFSNTAELDLVSVDPYYISFTIFDCTHGSEQVIRQTLNTKPLRFQQGGYFAPIKIDPRFYSIGRHFIVWEYQKYFDSTMESIAQSFDVVRQTHYSGEFCAQEPADDAQFKGYNLPKPKTVIRQ